MSTDLLEAKHRFQAQVAQHRADTANSVGEMLVYSQIAQTHDAAVEAIRNEHFKTYMECHFEIASLENCLVTGA